MSLLYVHDISPSVKIGLWKIDETEDLLLALNPYVASFKSSSEKFKSTKRRLEFLSVRALLYALTGDKSLIIEYETSGKPFLKDRNISISHTRGYAAVMLSHNDRVAIDIEYIDNRIKNITEKFIRRDETAVSLTSKIIHWSAKETVFKYFSEYDLQYFEMRVIPFDKAGEGDIKVENLKNGKTVTVHYILTDAYVLTYIR